MTSVTRQSKQFVY